MGESAGGGSIMHLITAYGGIKQPPSFQQVRKAVEVEHQYDTFQNQSIICYTLMRTSH